ncbi:acetyltransferase [Geothermobacter hydrogeniphilus]|uniref:Serine acetyltransferase n=1 Tax=Geothermobacter hydrogeniphilus TaxID=1969733 RepID=A0A1X0XSJ6_9BACT|nr:acetyltransferase [Geothermobacter hydrogeniphilus]ORJ55875.1 serine acetyltransferase [Geothermobacter hydrogeniphilus]
MKEKILIFGASGHAKVVIDIVEKQGLYEIEFLVDDDLSLKGDTFFGYSVLGGKEDLLAKVDAPRKAIVAIGSNRARGTVAAWLEQHGFELVTAIHPSAQAGRDVSLGAGSVVMANAAINAAATIGRNAIVNTHASIDHDCVIGDNVHIAPGATLCGTVTVGDGSFVAAGATVIPNLTIGRNVIIGAGSVVIRDLPDEVTVVGNPAKVISER